MKKAIVGSLIAEVPKARPSDDFSLLEEKNLLFRTSGEKKIA